MRCPICGAKLFQNQVCKYCKITDEEIKNASNKKVKEERKFGNTDLIHYSSVIPKDINKWKLWLYTIFLGVLGVNHFYINRPARAWFAVISTSVAMTILVVLLFIKINIESVLNVLMIVYDVAFLMMAVNVVLWICDIFNLIFRTFKVPIVLPEKDEIEVEKK